MACKCMQINVQKHKYEQHDPSTWSVVCTEHLGNRAMGDDVEDPLRVLELFAGIGGMRLALSYAGMAVDTVAVEVNQQALAVYSGNFGSEKVVNRDICSLTPQWFDRQQCRIWTMSPPCQPYTRQGHIRDAEDPRAKPLLHIIKILHEVTSPPEAIVVENVKNFEQSDSFALLCEALRARQYHWRSFLLSPRQFGFPNSRLRLYLVAKQRHHAFEHVPSLVSDETELGPWHNLPCPATQDWQSVPPVEERDCCVGCGRSAPAEEAGSCMFPPKSISTFLDKDPKDPSGSPLPNAEFLVPEKIMQKEAARCFDVVHESCCHSLCFTKAYGRYIDGTGSVFVSEKLEESLEDPGSYAMQEFYGRLRYFSPDEVARLLGFKLGACSGYSCLPKCEHDESAESDKSTCRCFVSFSLPAHPARELWSLLGNSLNPQVVGLVCKACDLPQLCQNGDRQYNIDEGWAWNETTGKLENNSFSHLSIYCCFLFFPCSVSFEPRWNQLLGGCCTQSSGDGKEEPWRCAAVGEGSSNFVWMSRWMSRWGLCLSLVILFFPTRRTVGLLDFKNLGLQSRPH